MRKVISYSAIAFLLSGILSCSAPQGTCYTLNGFRIYIDTLIYKPVNIENPNPYSYEQWKQIEKLGFMSKADSSILTFVFDSIQQERQVPFTEQIEKLQAKMSDSQLRVVDQYPLICVQNNYLKYCYVADTVNVVPFYFSGIMESESRRQIYFYYNFLSKEDIEIERLKLSNVLNSCRFSD